MIFRSPELESQFWKLHPRLRLILADADYWCHYHGVIPVATDFLRTEKEQLALYDAEVSRLIKEGKTQSEAEKISVSKKSSVHCYARGADWRILSPDSLNGDLIRYINTKYEYDSKRPEKKTVIRHVGTGDHLHFQCMEEGE